MSSVAMAAASYSDVVVSGEASHPPLQFAAEDLFEPPPTSMTLLAALMLLDTPLEPRPSEEANIPQIEEHVFLLTRTYLQNWLSWAFNQPASEKESPRIQLALRLAASIHKLTPPDTSSPYENPGPIDSTQLSVLGHPLLLRPHVVVGSANVANDFASSQPEDAMSDTGRDSIGSPKKPPAQSEVDRVGCCAVPEKFYELLRSTHGVLCSDLSSVSFQRYERAKRGSVAVQHHVLSAAGSKASLRAATNGLSNAKKIGGKVTRNVNATAQPRPVEFRRKVVFIRAYTPIPVSGFQTPMSKLLRREESLSKRFIAAVELYPIKFLYSVVTSEDNESSRPVSPPRPATRKDVTSLPGSPVCANPKDTIAVLAAVTSSEKSSKTPSKGIVDGPPSYPRPSANTSDNGGQPQITQSPSASKASGFILVSRTSLIADALQAVFDEVAPNKASTCVRIWSKMEKVGATAAGDGYELVDLDSLDGKLLPLEEESKVQEKSELTVAEWVRRQTGENSRVVSILVETRAHPSTEWSRKALELENRIQVGDVVDAQDTAGNWFEAVVRNVTDELVCVHYTGWSSRWDTKLRRRGNEAELDIRAKRVRAPAALWTHTSRWRQNIRIGDNVEVRESSSLFQRPRWLRGIVRAVGNENDPVRETICGAELEVYDSNGKKAPLLLLDRKQQVLVEVPQEKNNTALSLASAQGQSLPDSSGKQPQQSPFLRWVYLYGEEICQRGTHLHFEDDTNRPATLSYLYDTTKPPVEVLKSFNNIHGAGFVRESLRGVPPAPGSVGLHNLGNSCFLNSIVQCLNHIEPLTQYFLKGTYSKDLNRKNPLGSGGRVAVAFASLLNDMWGGEYSILAPRRLKQTVGFFAPQFNNVYQHDSHEFCSFLMDGLHEDLNRVKNKPYVEELEGRGMKDKKVAIESWRKHLLRHDSVIVDHCQGMHRSHLTCPICGRESIKFDVYSTISLPLPPLKADSMDIKECLEMFTAGEQLDDRNAWYCPSCKKHVCALKMIALWSVPDILIFHLKRFTFNTCKTSGGVVRSKIEDKVDFPIDNLDMTEYILGPIDDDAPPIYELFAVSEHSGHTANSGHYTATVRNSKDAQWYRFNDSHVGSTSGEAAVTGGAYMLFYRRRKGSSRWAGMERAMQNPGDDEVDKDGFTPVKSKKKHKKRAR